MELTPNVPGRLEALYHLQVFSVIILPGDKLETKLPQIHVNFFLASESHIGFGHLTKFSHFYPPISFHLATGKIIFIFV